MCSMPVQRHSKLQQMETSGPTDFFFLFFFLGIDDLQTVSDTEWHCESWPAGEKEVGSNRSREWHRLIVPSMKTPQQTLSLCWSLRCFFGYFNWFHQESNNRFCWVPKVVGYKRENLTEKHGKYCPTFVCSCSIALKDVSVCKQGCNSSNISNEFLFMSCHRA